MNGTLVTWFLVFFVKQLLMRSGDNRGLSPPGLRPKIALTRLLLARSVSGVIQSKRNSCCCERAKGAPAGYAGHNPSHNSGPFNEKSRRCSTQNEKADSHQFFVRPLFRSPEPIDPQGPFDREDRLIPGMLPIRQGFPKDQNSLISASSIVLVFFATA